MGTELFERNVLFTHNGVFPSLDRMSGRGSCRPPLTIVRLIYRSIRDVRQTNNCLAQIINRFNAIHSLDSFDSLDFDSFILMVLTSRCSIQINYLIG